MRKFAFPFVLLAVCVLRVSADISPAISINSFGSTVSENFNTLASSGTSNTTPAGWGFSETGSNQNTLYTASSGGTGAAFSGDTYSFGATAGDRAFGGVQSGSLVPVVGAQFTNNTGGTITSLTITYTGEQWRLGATGRTDRLDFQYSTTATSLSAGTYINFDALDFNGPVSNGTVGSLDGNANHATITGTITGLSIASGANFFIRWTDFNAAGADDGLAVDDFLLTASGTVPPPVAEGVIINEVDSDTDGSDALEFVELFDGGLGNTPLDGHTLVFYNGANDLSYAAFDLDGKTTNANGYFVIGNAGVAGVGLVIPDGTLQNGADAVALYKGDATAFPNGTAISLLNLDDAVVYDTGEADDPGLLALLAGGGQIDENDGGTGALNSIGRCDNGTGGARNTSTFRTMVPSAGAHNDCPPPPPPQVASDIVISQFYGSGGGANALFQNDYVELYNRGTTTVNTTGWSLQYAAASGSGWDFNKTPLGGPIEPGQYYLVKLASNGAIGAAVTDFNVSGPINMSGTSGKIAIVDSFDALTGNCPIGNLHLKDLVGYGGADCAEGGVTAPALSATTALFRAGNGSSDTNHNDFDFGTAAPGPRRTAAIVELPPFVLSTDPSTNGFNVPRDPTIVVTFTEPVTVDNGWFDINCSATGHHSEHTLAENGRIFDITPNVNLLAGETCTVTILQDKVHDQDAVDPPDTLFATHSWSFTVSNGTLPPYPPSVHLTLGNPSGATSDVNQFDNYLMEKPEYALSYNRDQGRPNWVSWHLSNEWYGSLARVDTFRADPQVPPQWYRVQGFDFSGSGFDRGHMVPNADRDKETSIPINQATYLMTNMVAQAPGNNQGPWADMENALRAITDQGNELYVISGPEGMGGTGSNGGITDKIAGDHVIVPANTWKVVLVLPKATGDDVSRASCATRSIAVIMPNRDSIRDDDWEDYITSVDAVEALTGYDFFANLPDRIEYCVEAGINGANPPEDLEPPTITCGSADSLWHAGNVTLSCAASDSGSGLAHTADVSFTLSTSVVDFTEDGNASTTSRQVCDKAGNCTEAIVSGNKIDRKAPVTSCSSADGLWHNGDVAIACTATDGGSGLAAGDAAFSLTTGVVAGTDSSNASTDSRTVCDAVGHCVTAGPIGGNKIDRKAPDVSCGSADAAWHADNVSIACTASDSGAGVSAPDAAFLLTTSVGAETENASASTGSVAVCDLVGNCTTAGPVAGNKIDRKAPSVSCGAADGAWHGGNVSIACTSADGGSGLAVAGDASFSLSTSVADGTDNANASTGSRDVCDAMGRCATAGPIAGNKIDRKNPEITLTTPVNGGVYQLNRSIAAAFSCADGGSSVSSCLGTTASGAAIDTASLGTKSFAVTATDAAGNSSTRMVGYTVADGSISINNVPAHAFVGQSFTPAFNYAGDGATSVTSTTPTRCSVSGGVVTLLKQGTCTLIAHAAATTNFAAATGPNQSVGVTKRTPSISIANLPANAVVRGSFTPAFAYDGDASPQVLSLTPAVCEVRPGGSVAFTHAGWCVLLPFAPPTETVTAALGWPQWFEVKKK